MYITSSAVQMNSSRDYRESYYKATTKASWNVLTGCYNVEQTIDSSDSAECSESKENGNAKGGSNNFSDTLSNLRQRFEETRDIARVETTNLDNVKKFQNMKQQMINYLLYLLFGKKEGQSNPMDTCTDLSSDSSTVPIQNGGSGGMSESYFYYSESENVSFTTKACVNTSDGRSIDVNLTMELSRSFVSETSEYVEYGQPLVCDPLVINLDVSSASLTDQKFYFDLDSDGSKEYISMAGKGSAFLAYDKNEDGIINDGSELFGTQSGNGFEDLRQYDQDGNGWIDEADEIFSKLKVWSKDEYGNDKLVAIGQAGLGAIYLGSKETQFSLTNPENQVNAYVRRSGLFLYENGMSGTIQQLDLAKGTDQKV